MRIHFAIVSAVHNQEIHHRVDFVILRCAISLGLSNTFYYVLFSNAALLVLLQLPSLSIDGSNFSLWGSGEMWMLLAAQSMAVGTVMVRWVSKYSDPIMATGWVRLKPHFNLSYESLYAESSEMMIIYMLHSYISIFAKKNLIV